jgi:peptidyl-prolyl cis-trans isomerase SurA
MPGRVILIILLCSCAINVSGQKKKIKSKKTDVLFTLNGKAIRSEEFIYLYNKNHQARSGEYSKEDIVQYLDLFINFKLKVEEAKQRGMDTTRAFQSEYNSYRGELIKPYLPDNRIVDSLTVITYERLKYEVKASHILISVKPDASPEDTLAAFNKIADLKKRVLNGDDFGSLAASYSEDPSAASNKGDLGYFTALQMVYPFETAAYETPVGETAGPVRTQFGYHIIKVFDKIPSRGEVEVAHIMIRASDGTNKEKAKNTIFDIYDQLAAGAKWEEVCRQYSEDQGSKENGGKLRPFGPGTMSSVPPFETIAFSLKVQGDISDPFETAYGWHIMRLERKIPLPSFDDIKSQLRNKVARDQRVQISRAAWQSSLKKEFRFNENTSTKEKILPKADSSIKYGEWDFKNLSSDHSEILFSLRNKSYNVRDFIDFIQRNRLTGKDAQMNGQNFFARYVDETLMKLFEDKLSEENIEFAMLSKEYYEGILLFDIMEDEVWNKAADDSLGQVNFFNENRSKYTAGERAKANIYSSTDSMFRVPLRKLLTDGDSVALEQFVRENKVKQEKGLYEKGDATLIDKFPWQPGVHSTENKGMYYLAQILSILLPGPMTFEEARASVVADLQEALEKNWINQLRKKYPVKVNEKGKAYVLDKLEK